MACAAGWAFGARSTASLVPGMPGGLVVGYVPRQGARVGDGGAWGGDGFTWSRDDESVWHQRYS